MPYNLFHLFYIHTYISIYCHSDTTLNAINTGLAIRLDKGNNSNNNHNIACSPFLKSKRILINMNNITIQLKFTHSNINTYTNRHKSTDQIIIYRTLYSLCHATLFSQIYHIINFNQKILNTDNEIDNKIHN